MSGCISLLHPDVFLAMLLKISCVSPTFQPPLFLWEVELPISLSLKKGLCDWEIQAAFPTDPVSGVLNITFLNKNTFFLHHEVSFIVSFFS
jgi:hypothetical protein